MDVQAQTKQKAKRKKNERRRRHPHMEQNANDANDENDEPLVTFMETVEHVGGAPVIICGVLLLAVAYLVLVEWLLPRRRQQHSQQHHQRLRSAKKRNVQGRNRSCDDGPDSAAIVRPQTRGRKDIHDRQPIPWKDPKPARRRAKKIAKRGRTRAP